MRDKCHGRRTQVVRALTCTPVDAGDSSPHMPRMTTDLLPVNKQLNFTKPALCVAPLCIPRST